MRKKKNTELTLFHKAAIVMSLLSWYTTYGGFKNSVFMNGQGLTAGLASMAIQVILLGGVLYLIPILSSIYRKGKELIKGLKEKEERKIKIWGERVKRFFMITAVTGIFILAMVTSITFSYISISNNIYKIDFEVNANIELDKFMRNIIQGMETDNEEYLDVMRAKIICQLKENGQDIIKKSAERRARDYADTTGTLLMLAKTKELVSLDKRIRKIYKGDLLKNEKEEIEYRYRFIKQDYADQLYKDFIVEENLGNTRFAAGVKNKINNINRDKFAIYCEYHHQYLAAVYCYNEWIQKLKNDGDVPTLEQMNSLKDFCETIHDGLKKLETTLDGMKDSHAEQNTIRLIEEAKMNMDSLILEVDNISEKAEILIKNSYGKDALSFEELISRFGSSETPPNDLDTARRQLLGMQGTLLSTKNVSDSTIDNVTSLIHNLEKYIDAIKYNNKLELLKQKININYNIVKSVEKDESVENIDIYQDKSSRSESVSGHVNKGNIQAASSEDASGAVSSGATSGGAVSDKGISGDVSVVDITSEKWTEVKKSQMTELDGLIYNNPVKMYYPEVKRGGLKDAVNLDDKNFSVVKEKKGNGKTEKYKSIYIEYKKEAEKFRKSYLDTSEMEKAYNLIAGDNQLFPYKGKAKLALVFAIFLDFGAFLIGVVMFFARKDVEKAG